jgi:integrase
MSRQPSPPRLWKRPERRDKAGRVTHAALWFILDGGRQFGTGVSVDDIRGAQKALADHINSKHIEEARSGPRPTDKIPVVDVLTIYAKEVAPKHAQPQRTAHALRRLGKFFAGKTLADINGPLCRDYVRTQSTDTTARRDLEHLRAAINHHRHEGLHDRIVSVVMPDKRPPRERWLTRSEAARLLWAAYRHKRDPKEGGFGIYSRRHIARFILVALYTGSRAQAVAQAALQKEPGRAYVDLDRGIFYRRPEGQKETSKRRPPVRLPDELLHHLRRWKRNGARYVVEWQGQPVKWIHTVFTAAVKEAGLEGTVTPHTLRHTAATWLMQGGCDLWTAAGFLGMTVQTLERVYGHHHPGHLEGVRGAFRKAKLPTVHQRIT